MDLRKLKAKISVFLVLMLIFWLAGSSLIYASDAELISETEEPPGFVSNLLEAVRSFVDNVKSLFGVNGVEAAEESNKSEDSEEKEDEAEEEGPGSGNNFGEEVSNIAQGLRTGDATVDDLGEKTTSIHLQILEEVHRKVPQAAREAILGAMENSMVGNAVALDALKNKGAFDSDDEDQEDEIENEEVGSKGRGRENASEMGRQMRDNKPSNR